ncbi:MAG: phosphoglucosamine mutase [Firmicutes bacterium]|nr:phosphoglucosamine mutase [Bacillota bacterium]
MGKLFGTDGVRGVANEDLTAELAYKLGQAGAYVLTAETKHIPKILVGMDTRVSGHMLKSALVAGICSVGAEAVCLGVLPTPAIAYLTRYYGADAGVVISASHNPFEFNGIKFFDGRGYKLKDSIEERIESIILDGNEELPKPTGREIGRKSIKESALEDYIVFLNSTVDVSLKGLKIALDCANGAAWKVAPEVMQRLGAEVYIINNNPDGTNINKGCGSTHYNGIKKFVKECGADIGLAFDGDADRVIAADERGNIVDGDQIIAITGLQMKKEGRLAQNTIVITVMTNMGFDVMAKREGINIVKTKVGDRYVLEEMLNNGYNLGGEQSGHVIFLEHNTTGDGIITALQLLRVMKITGKPLSELASVMQVFPQVLKNAKVQNENKYKYLEDKIIADMCRHLEEEFNGEGRVLIRPSGTEPLIRVMIEGQDINYITKKAEDLVEVIEARLG